MAEPYRSYIRDKRLELDTIMTQYGTAFTADPFEVLEQNGAIATMMDRVAEHTVLKAFYSAQTVEDAITELDRYAIVQLEASTAAGRAAEMNVVLNRWIQGWRRRLEKFQRENPSL